jgi:glycerol-3-phosphate acyltransferase PlsY
LPNPCNLRNLRIVAYLALLAAYILGAIPFGYLIYRARTGRDIRGEQAGSGNIGATNVARLTGQAAGAVTLLLDVGKGYLGVLLAGWAAGGDRAWMSAGAVAVLLGHMFPVFLGFRGGKGVASALGAFAALAPWAVLVALGVFLGLLAIWRYVSLGSVISAILFPLAAWFIYHPPLGQTLGAALAALLITIKHHANIRRLLAGQEPKFGGASTTT